MNALTEAADRVVETAETLSKRVEAAVENELVGNKTAKDGSAAPVAGASGTASPTSISSLFVALKGSLNVIGTPPANYDQIVSAAIASTPTNEVEIVISKVRALMGYAKNDLTAFDEAVVFARTLVKI